MCKCMREVSLMGRKMGRGKRSLSMGMFMKGSIVRISSMERASTYGIMVHAISVILFKESDKVRVSGSQIPLMLKSYKTSNKTDQHQNSKETTTKASTKTIRNMGLEYTGGKMEPFMKGSLKMIKRLDKVC